MQLILNNIKYEDKLSSNATLVENVKGVEGQTTLLADQKTLDQQSYQLSTRNAAGSYLLPTEKDIVYLNYIPRKKIVSDLEIQTQLNPQFEFFVDEVITPPDPFTLADGQFFRCASAGSTPLPKEQYTYYIMMDGVAKMIPNYKTLEVMLAERNQSLLSIRVLEANQCDEIPKEQSGIGDKTGQWTEEFKDQTNFEVLKELEASVKSGQAIASAATKSAEQQIAAVKAAEEKAKEQAAQAKAEANAAAQKAQAEIAKAEQAKAEADKAKAEAEAEKAKFESQNNGDN